jgi:hypothetical protein
MNIDLERFHQIGKDMKGLEATHKAGLKYPIPTYMIYAPGFQEFFENNAFERAGGSIAREQDESG